MKRRWGEGRLEAAVKDMRERRGVVRCMMTRECSCGYLIKNGLGVDAALELGEGG